MYLREKIEQERALWQRKPQLRLLKNDYYGQIQSFLPREGRIVELGSGCGGLKEFLPRTVATDIHPVPWVDVALVAERLPFAAQTVDALVALDVLHHMEEPLSFFREAARVLRPGGRVVLLEPYVSAGSWIPWHWMHHEGCTMTEPFDFNRSFAAENNARATLWFGRNARVMQELVRPLAVESTRHLDLFYYPLTGGFRPWALVPQPLAPAVLRADRWLARWLGRALGYRMLIVFQKPGAA